MLTSTQKTHRSHDEISVCGLIVHTMPDNLAGVQERLITLHGVEVHTSAPEGKLVVTVEENPGEKRVVDTITQIGKVEGVLSTSLIYSHFYSPEDNSSQENGSSPKDSTSPKNNYSPEDTHDIEGATSIKGSQNQMHGSE